MPYLVDTNVLLRLLQQGDPHHQAIRVALRTLRQRGEQLCFTLQNLVEFWCVCTHPTTANGFGLTVAETDRRARVIERLLTLLPGSPVMHAEWRRLVMAHAVSGVQVYEQHLDNLRRKDALRGAETTETSVRLGSYSASHFEGSAYDARLIAAMRVHGVTNILTLNIDDFTRYPGLTVVHLQDIENT